MPQIDIKVRVGKISIATSTDIPNTWPYSEQQQMMLNILDKTIEMIKEAKSGIYITGDN